MVDPKDGQLRTPKQPPGWAAIDAPTRATSPAVYSPAVYSPAVSGEASADAASRLRQRAGRRPLVGPAGARAVDDMPTLPVRTPAHPLVYPGSGTSPPSLPGPFAKKANMHRPVSAVATVSQRSLAAVAALVLCLVLVACLDLMPPRPLPPPWHPFSGTLRRTAT